MPVPAWKRGCLRRVAGRRVVRAHQPARGNHGNVRNGAAAEARDAEHALLPAGLCVAAVAIAAVVGRGAAADAAPAAGNVDECVALTVLIAAKRGGIAKYDRIVAEVRGIDRVGARVVPHHFRNVGGAARQRSRLIHRVPVLRRIREIIEVSAAHCQIVRRRGESIHGESIGIDVVRDSEIGLGRTSRDAGIVGGDRDRDALGDRLLVEGIDCELLEA